jgi:hypothetical protein
MISPHFEKAESSFENVVFVKVDVDEQPVGFPRQSSRSQAHRISLTVLGNRPSMEHPSHAYFLGFQEGREDWRVDWRRSR